MARNNDYEDDFDDFEAEFEDHELEEDEYHDDPLSKPKLDKRRLFVGFGSAVLLLVSASYYLSTSIGGRFTIAPNNEIIFGQGAIRTGGCTESASLEISASSVFNKDNDQFRIEAITVKNIPSQCVYKDLVISAYDALGNNEGLSLYNQSFKKIHIYKRSDYTYELGKFSTGLSVSTNSSTSFTVNISSPIATSGSIDKFTVESVDHEEWFCKDGGDCRVGDVGPGGGTIFYVNGPGFNCGSSYSATGSPTGGKCHYLEVAPANWAGATGKAVITYDKKYSSNFWNGTSYDRWGEGFMLTNNIYNDSGVPVANRCATDGTSTVATCQYAQPVTRLYRGGSFDDWYAPNVSEAKTLCDWLWSSSGGCVSTNPSKVIPPYISAYSVHGGLITASTINDLNRIYLVYISLKTLTCSNNKIGNVVFWDPVNLNRNDCLTKFVLPIRAF